MMMLRPQTKPPTTTGAELQALQQRLPASQPAAALQAHNLVSLVGQSVARSVGNTLASAALFPLMLTPEAGNDLFAMQAAVAGRAQQMQQDWLQAWNFWLGEFSQARRATTLSEHVELQYNLVAQFGALLKGQASDLLDLEENVQVAYGYWVAQQLQAMDTKGLPAP